MQKIICGIDLGTTNSVIAYLNKGRPEALCIDDGTAILPSVISMGEEQGQLFVGRPALNRLAAFPESTVRSVKRLMGKETLLQLGKKQHSPEELSSFLLRHLVDKASEALGQKIEKVVITVPAYFDDAQRRATIRAGELAGLEVTRIVNEPTAAALVYDQVDSEDFSQNPYLMVYDLGGGTFDVSIIEVKGEIKEVLASCGDTALGGDDFDERLKDFFLRHLRERTGHDLSAERRLEIRLRDIAERTKIKLSDRPYVLVNEVAVTNLDGEPVNLELEVSRAEFEEMTDDLLTKTIRKVEEALHESSLEAEEIGKIVLVGGATRMPAVQEVLSEMFDRPIEHSIDPDLCVALGAAVQAGLIAGEPLGHILLDVTAHSLGVKTADCAHPETGEADYFSPIIRRNTRIPASHAEVYFTIVDSQTGVEVEVYQGESPSCLENTEVGKFHFPLKPAPSNSPVTVEFTYDREGIVHVSVDQKGYNNRKSVTLDVRRRKLQDHSQAKLEATPINYISEKARRLIDNVQLPAVLKTELTEITFGYEQAITDGEDDRKVEELEDQLLEKIEEAEEGLEEIGQEEEQEN
ncbi:MAG: Hsp70 family protein [Desulfoferrobacter sp.]